MNIEAQAELDRIVAVGPEGLTEPEAGFLRARRSYLNEEQRTVFASVLAEAPSEVAEAEEAVEAAAETAPKKLKK